MLSAREFVGWFNGDPRCVAENDASIASALADPRGDTAVIFGLGNVAVDCARILLRDPNHLAETDVCEHALRALRSSAIRRVALIGRRGVAQAAFSPKELRELLNLPGVRVTIDEADMATEAEDEADLEASRPRRRAKDALEKATSRLPAGADADASSGTAKELAVKFLRSPRTFHPMDATDASERVGSVTLTVNRLEGPAGRRRAIATDAAETLAGVSLALRSVGYRAKPIPSDAGFVPFDASRGVVQNTLGRVATPTGTGKPGTGTGTGLYVCGWLKRGPTGIIGTNLRDAEETVASVVEDDAAGALARPAREYGDLGVAPLLRERGAEVVDAEGWRRIDAAERAAGAAVGKPREKFIRVDDMLAVARGA